LNKRFKNKYQYKLVFFFSINNPSGFAFKADVYEIELGERPEYKAALRKIFHIPNLEFHENYRRRFPTTRGHGCRVDESKNKSLINKL
jgi:hypothetical protein